MKIKSCTILLFFACLCSIFNQIYAAGKGPNALFLTCGSSAVGTDADGRKWEPDSKYLISGDKQNVAEATTQDPSLPSDVPYMTTRIFTSETTYEFPITDTTSRPLLRLHFYPGSYPKFNISNSYFAVTAGKTILVSNFSAYITAEALSQGYIIKEYFLAAIDSSTLKVTIKPSNGSFAFINGIELITSPPLFDQDPKLVGVSSQDASTNLGPFDQSMSITPNSLETMFRVNVGGQYISPKTDSAGLERSWYDDTPYVFGASTGVSYEANVSINYKAIQPYFAPNDVYTTVRAMGPDSNLNKQYNLTWVFQVDANFSYLVRFHWCDWQMDRVNQRVFTIYINNKTAEAQADVIDWAKKKGDPIYKDYIIYVDDKSGGDDQIWVGLHPSVTSKPEYLDAILNGLEIFKISDAKSNLAGPNPAISNLMQKYLESEQVPQFNNGKKTYTGTLSSFLINFSSKL